MPETGTLIAIKALLANNEIARFGMRFLDDGLTPFTSADLLALAETAQVELNAHASIYAGDMLLGLCSAQRFEHAVGPGPNFTPYWKPTTSEHLATTASTPGTAGGSSSPPQVAVVATLKTLLAGKSHTGRLYTFPPPEGEVSGTGLISDVGDRRDFVEDLQTAIEGSAEGVAHGMQLAVFSAKLDVATPVQVITMNTRVDTQRRRLQR